MTSNDLAHAKWSDIHPDWKSETDGERRVLYWDEKLGTVLGPWFGPNCDGRCNA